MLYIKREHYTCLCEVYLMQLDAGRPAAASPNIDNAMAAATQNTVVASNTGFNTLRQAIV